MHRKQIRWFRPGGEGTAVSKREFRSLEKEGQAALLVQLKKLSVGEIDLRTLRHLGNQIYEIRVQIRGNHYRMTVFQDSPVHILVLSCFFKNQNREPNEIKKAQGRLNEWKRGRHGGQNF